MKYDGHSGLHAHIMNMSDLIYQLKGMNMTNSEGFFFHFIMKGKTQCLMSFNKN